MRCRRRFTWRLVFEIVALFGTAATTALLADVPDEGRAKRRLV
jgi:predicted MFS family arabinose efflux permease